MKNIINSKPKAQKQTIDLIIANGKFYQPVLSDYPNISYRKTKKENLLELDNIKGRIIDLRVRAANETIHYKIIIDSDDIIYLLHLQDSGTTNRTLYKLLNAVLGLDVIITPVLLKEDKGVSQYDIKVEQLVYGKPVEVGPLYSGSNPHPKFPKDSDTYFDMKKSDREEFLKRQHKFFLSEIIPELTEKIEASWGGFNEADFAFGEPILEQGKYYHEEYDNPSPDYILQF